MSKVQPAVGDLVHAQLPTHGVLWSKEHGWHLAIFDATGAVAERRKANPGSGKARVVAVNDDGTLDLELPGHRTNEVGHRRGPGSLYDAHGYAPAEIVRGVPNADDAELFDEAPGAMRYQRGPHWTT